MPTSELLTIEEVHGIGMVGLNRPSSRNAINDAMISELAAYFESIPSSVRVVVLHGAGEHFCAGLDLKELVAKRTGEFLPPIRRSRNWHRTFDLIQFGEVPVVSVLKGAVIGGGLELASATHVRVSEPSTFYQLPEGQRGVFLGGSGSVRIPRIIGASRVMDMMLTGRVYSYDEGLTLGLAHYGAEEGQGLTRAMEMATTVSNNSASGNFAIINGIGRIPDMGTAEGMFTETMVTALARSDSNSSERITEFFDERKRAKEPPTQSDGG